MSAVRMVYLQCDVDGCESTTADECFDRALDARQFAHEQGWSSRGGRDTCPHCRAGRGPYQHGDEHLDADELAAAHARRR